MYLTTWSCRDNFNNMASILCRPQCVKESVSIRKLFDNLPGHKIGIALDGGTRMLFIV